MKTEHEWTEDDTKFAVFPDKRHPNGAPAHVVAGFAMEPYISSGALIREVLRLAQREADLLTRATEALSVLQVSQPPFAQAVYVLAHEAELNHSALARATSELAALNTVKQDKYALEKERDGLARRVGNLKRSIDHLDTELRRKSDDLAAARSANDLLGGKINRLEEELRQAEHRESLWKASAEKAGQRVRDLESAIRGKDLGLVSQGKLIASRGVRIIALERENRDKTLELAQNAGRIREMEEQLAGEIMKNQALKMMVEEGSEIEAELAEALAAGHGEGLRPCKAPCPGHLGPKARAAVLRAAEAWRLANEENDRHIARIVELEASCTGWHVRSDEARAIADSYRDQNCGLLAAIEDGIAHVENARQALLGELDRTGLGTLGRHLIERLDLAHEVLSNASRAPGVDTTPAVSGVDQRVSVLEAAAQRHDETLSTLKATAERLEANLKWLAERGDMVERRVAHIEGSLRKYTGWLEPSAAANDNDSPE